MAVPARNAGPNTGPNTGKAGKAEAGALVAQPHGGAIKQRGNPGNKGGPGPPRDELRAMLRNFVWEKWPALLERWATLDDDQKLRVVETGLRYGLGTQTEAMTPERVAEEQRAMVQVFTAALRAELSDDVAQRVVARFRELWGQR